MYIFVFDLIAFSEKVEQLEKTIDQHEKSIEDLRALVSSIASDYSSIARDYAFVDSQRRQRALRCLEDCFKAVLCDAAKPPQKQPRDVTLRLHLPTLGLTTNV